MGQRPDTFQPLTIGGGIRASAVRAPKKVALGQGERELSYASLVDRMDRVSMAAVTDLGLKLGDHAALMAPNCLEFIEIVAGLSSAGIATAMVNPRFTPPEVAYICNDSGARVLFVHEKVEDVVRAADLQSVERIIVIGGDYDDWIAAAKPLCPEASVEEWDVFAIPYTAGTTGKPKGVLLSHRSRALTFFAMASEYGCYGPDDRALAVAPLFHGAGFVFAVAPIFFGGFVEIMPAFNPEELLTTCNRLAISNTFMVPTHFNALFALEKKLLAANQPRTLRTIISNAAPLPQVTKERIVDYFGETVLHETYGSTEGGIVTNLRPVDQLRKKQCVGLPFPSTHVKLLGEDGSEVPQGEVGELYSLSPYLFNGYWQQEEATRGGLRNGWLSVGDMARKDEEGYLYLVDRKNDVIISGGVNIYPREIEEVLATHPSVAEVAVVGLPDNYWGEAVKAFVTLRPKTTFTEEDLVTHCAARLAGYKLPKSLEVIDALPRNAAGKVLKRSLRERA